MYLNVFLFLALQTRLTALPPTLRSMKTDYASLRSQVRNFSDFYGAAINDAKKQVLKGYILRYCYVSRT